MGNNVIVSLNPKYFFFGLMLFHFIEKNCKDLLSKQKKKLQTVTNEYK